MDLYVEIILVTTLIAFAYCYADRKYRKLFFSLMVIFPSFFSGFRKVGTDYYVYLNRFRYITEKISDGEFTTLFYRAIKLIKLFCGNYQVVICVTSFITIYIAFYLICQHESEINIIVSVFSYMTMFYFLSFNIFRQWMAAEIYALGVFLIIKKQKKNLGLLVLFVAVVVHSSVLPYAAVVAILSWISEYSRMKIRVVVYIVLLTGVLLLPRMANSTDMIRNILPHYAYYFLHFKYQGFGLGMFRYILLVCLMLFLLRISGNMKEKTYTAYAFLSIVGVVMTYLSYVSDTFIYRIGYIGLVFLPVLHGYFAKKFFNISCEKRIFLVKYNAVNGKIGVFYFISLIVLLLFFFWYDFVFLNTGEILPYQISFYMQ